MLLYNKNHTKLFTMLPLGKRRELVGAGIKRFYTHAAQKKAVSFSGTRLKSSLQKLFGYAQKTSY